MDFYTTIGVVSSAITIADKKKSIDSLLKKIFKYINNGSTNIIIFGAGGTGKTTLSKTLIGETIHEHIYNETPNIEKLKISHGVFGNYLVAPGQERRVERYWPDLFRRLNKGQITGIINVVSYGYHSMDIGNNSYKSTTYFDNESEMEFINKYLDKKREDELKYLKKISEQIKNTDKKFWLITLVNKQDLWWDEKDLVEAYYTNGEYDSVIEEIFSSKGKNNFIHEYVSCSLTPCNFAFGKDLEVKTTSGYDLPLQQNNYNNFINLLYTLIDG